MLIEKKSQSVTPTPDPPAGDELLPVAEEIAFMETARFEDAKQRYLATRHRLDVVRQQDNDLHETMTTSLDRAARRAAQIEKDRLRPELERLVDLLGDERAGGEGFDPANAPLYVAWTKRLARHEREQQASHALKELHACEEKIWHRLDVVQLELIVRQRLRSQMGLDAAPIQDDCFASLRHVLRGLYERRTHHG